MRIRFLPAIVVLLLVPTARSQSFNYPDFTSVAGLNLVGLASQAGNILRLQDNLAPAVNPDNRGGAWYAQSVCVAYGFDTTFTYRMHTPSTTGGADGLAFVIQNDQGGNPQQVNPAPNVGPGNTALGRHASAMGYGLFANSLPGESIDNSLAIELDTFLNGAPVSDLDANHIGIHTGGAADNNQNESFAIGRADSATVVTNLNDGVAHSVRVVYVPGTLQVYLDGVLKITTSYSFSTGGTYLAGGTVGGLNLIGGSSAYVGFTSGAGTAREFRDIQSWSWTSNCTTPSTAFCDGSLAGACAGCVPNNTGAAGRGCANSSFAAGTELVTSGLASLANDTLVLTTNDMPGPGLFFQSNGLNTLNPFGDGMLCAAVGIIRMGVVFPNATFNASYPGGLTPNPISIAGAPIAAGDTKHYQVWYRDADLTFCSTSLFNTSNGRTLTWGP